LESGLIPVTISLLTETTTRSNVLFIYGFLNPFSGEWKDITTYQLPEWQPVIYPAFSANMSQFLYARYSNNKVVLWDIEEEKLIWEREEPNIYHQTVEWTQDGERAAIMLRLNEGITTVTSFGEEHYIPFIGEYPEIWSIGFSFSPDGSFLAIINGKREIDSTSSDYEIGIYSFEAKQYVLKCPIIADIDSMVNRLVWSPDNRYLATSFTNIELRDTFTPLLVYDIDTGNVYHIAGDGSAVGWLEVGQ
jgi:WD40 repeat protein